MGLADRDYFRNQSWKYGSGRSKPDSRGKPPKQRASSDRWLKSGKIVRDDDIRADYARDKRARDRERKRRWPGILRFAVVVIAFGVAGGIAFSIVREMI